MDISKCCKALASGGPAEERLQAAADLGKAGPDAREALNILRRIAADKQEAVIVRGYVAWAANEIEPRPAADPGRTYHVAQKHPQADDANDGGAERPWKTVQRAAETHRPGDTVVIHDGVYRECVRPFVGGTGPDRFVAYRAAPGERPVVTGADEWRVKWRNEGHRIWSAPYSRLPWDWPEKGPEPVTGPRGRTEQIIVGGQLLVHVATREEMEDTEDSFFTEDSDGRVWIHMVDDVPPHRMLVERSVRQMIFAPAVRGLGYIRVAGLVMRYGANPEVSRSSAKASACQALLSTRTGHHWIIEDNLIEWGNAQGLDIGSEGWGEALKEQPLVIDEAGWHEVRRNAVNYHGSAGIVGAGAPGQQHLVLEDNETSFNGRKAGGKAGEAAGLKIEGARDCVVRRHAAVGNSGDGIRLACGAERCRITQCICIDNSGEGVVCEEGAGPVLIDTNVLADTRAVPAQGGLALRGASRAVCANNYVGGCRFGVRLRGIFGGGGMQAATSHNRAWNNFLVDAAEAAVSLNPETAGADDNASEANILWAGGRRVAMRLENADAGVRWDETAIGRAMRLAGGGNVAVPLETWQEVLGQDRGSLVFPVSLLGAEKPPEEIRALLEELWPEDAPDLDAGYGDVRPAPAAGLVAAQRPELAGARPVGTLWLAPSVGLQVWKKEGGMLAVLWDGDDSADIFPLAEAALLNPPEPAPAEPPPLVAGETRSVAALAGGRVAFSGLDAEVEGLHLTVSAPEDAAPGPYGVVLVADDRWQYVPITVAPVFALGDLTFSRGGGKAVVVPIANNGGEPVEAAASMKFGEERASARLTVPARATVAARLPLELDAAGEAQVTVELGGKALTKTALASFVCAVRAATWDDVPRYSIDDFPGGAFAEGAAAPEGCAEGLSARFAARCDEAALRLLVEVRDDEHHQTRGPERLDEEDSLQVAAKAVMGLRPLEIVLGLNSETGEVLVARRQAPDEARYPPGPAPDVPAKVRREGRMTIYEVALPWQMLGLASVPPAGRPIRLSLLVNDNGGRGRHGLQWFFGIRDYRNDERMLGTVWLG